MLLAERGGLTASDPEMRRARDALMKRLDNNRIKGGLERVAKAVDETEEKTSKSDLEKILEEITVTTGSLWFNLSMLFNHFWTVTKLIFVYNIEAGHELLKKEGYGNVPPDELEAQIQEIIEIIKKLMTENIHSAIETLAKHLSDPVMKRAEQDKRLPLLGARRLKEQIKMGKEKLALMQTLITDLKEECDVHNYYLARLVREVKREINSRNAARKDSRQKHWKRAKNMVGMVMKFSKS